MKKMNKKGFTLIELLAVIIILGVLMIIAIPSVTQYIQNSRKSAMVDTASSFVDGVRTKVNEASDLKFFDTDTLYLVAVGDGEGDWKSCISLEKGGSSPFGDWTKAYVGVTYDGKGYDYFFYGVDDSKQGIEFATQKELADGEFKEKVNDSKELVQSGLEAWNAQSCVNSESASPKCSSQGTKATDALTKAGGKTNLVVVNATENGSCTYTAE